MKHSSTPLHVDAIPAAVVVSDAAPLTLLELARRLRPDVRLRLGESAAVSLAEEEWPRAVLVAPSPALLAALRTCALARGASVEIWRSDAQGSDLYTIAVPGRTKQSQ